MTMVWLAIAVFLLLALISYTPNDPSWSHVSSDMAGSTSAVSNLAGQAGAWLADICYMFLGLAAWGLIFIAAYEAWIVWRNNRQPIGLLRAIGYLFMLMGVSALEVLVLPVTWFGHGIIGQIVGTGLSSWMTGVGASIFLILLVLLTATFSFDIHWLSWLKRKQAERSPTQYPSKQAKNSPQKTANLSPRMINDTAEPLATQIPLPLETLTESESLENSTMSDPSQPKIKTGNALSRFLRQSRVNTATAEQKTHNQAESETAPMVDEDMIAKEMQTAKLDEALYKEAINKTPNIAKSIDQPSIAEVEQTRIEPANKVASPIIQSDTLNNKDLEENTPTPTFFTQTSSEITSEAISQFGDSNIPQDDKVAILESDNVDNLASQNVADSSEPTTFQTPVFQASVLPTSVELEPQAVFEPEIPQNATLVDHQTPPEALALPTTSDNPLDIHNDSLFQAKSRAMQTAAYRASLTPVPELSILDLPDTNRKPSYSAQQLQQMAELLQIKLQEFNVKSTVVNAEPGPVVTRFEVDLAPGIKASKVTGIARDLARSLSMASVRVVEVIPGKPYIGIEVPNPTREMVRLIELLDTQDYRNPNSHISMAMGKDIAGRPVITDLARAPHMLVAGTTGSGKSVLVNSMLLSILLKYTPEQLRMILIDPKQLELANYNDIPHLLTPVVTDMTEAASALSWCVAEMERRYLLMSLFKVRKLDEFNKKVLSAEASGQPLIDPLWRPNDSVSVTSPPKLKTLPLIVIVADEFADMIMQVGKQAEDLITRLAQKSRAAGIHLILATQRPSVDVITGLIKANIPARAALRVNSKIDSRTILDAGGAEDMLGNGDMLFLGPGQIEPNRVHGAYVSDSEVNHVCDAWRERGSPDYIDNMFDNFDLSSPSSSGGGESSISTGDQDPFYDEAVAFVLETRKVSASSIQRKFSIGYNRAARLVDAMEEAGLVSSLGKNGKRELLM